MAENKKIVQVTFNTFDPKLPKFCNVQLLEIDVELFSDMSRQEFMSHTTEAANEFWLQMKRGRLRNKLLAPKKVIELAKGEFE